MKLKILSILVGAILLFLALCYAVNRLLVFQSYASLEKKEVAENVARCFGALQREIDYLDTVTYDWAAWDDTYRYVQDRNEDYIESNMVESSFSDNQIHLIYIFDTRRNVVWGEVRAPETFEKIDLDELAPENIMAVRGLFQPDEPGESVSGVWLTSRHPILISSRPITTSDDEGPVLGYFLMGRFLTEEHIESLSRQTRVLHQYHPIRNGQAGSVPEDILHRLTEGSPTVLAPVNADLMRAYAIFPDILGEPALVLQVDTERSTLAQGRRALWAVLISVSMAGAVLLVVMLLFCSRVVIRPLSDLTAQVVAFGKHQSIPGGSLSGRRDEIGLLYREFKNMADQLQQVHQGFRETNVQLAHEVREHRITENELLINQKRLRALSSEQVKIEERERRRLAVELHDRIGQGLAVLQMQIELLLKQVPSHPENAGTIRALIENIIHESRSLIFEISPPVLYELGLGPAIEWLAEEIMAHHDISIEARNNLKTPLEDSIRALVFRSVRELLFNVVKHAEADHAWVKVEQTGGDLRIEVRDNGVGFNPGKEVLSEKGATGFGLFSIQERFQQLGGKLDIIPGDEGGTVATLTLALTLSMGVLIVDKHVEAP